MTSWSTPARSSPRAAARARMWRTGARRSSMKASKRVRSAGLRAASSTIAGSRAPAGVVRSTDTRLAIRVTRSSRRLPVSGAAVQRPMQAPAARRRSSRVGQRR